MYYRSKKGPGFFAVYWMMILLMSVPPIFFLQTHIFSLIITLALSGILIWIWFKTGYTINGEKLHIHYGPFKKEINIIEIHSLRETKNPFIDPALSINKIEIIYQKYETTAISPINKGQFIQSLVEINPNIQFKR
ncbi:PH domain-containing protein [Cytobacillus horneckiae]|nr:PH domain-containing protein [Cytobacillus horneckiae]MEC1157858.1 PH domain-containing protein [Cytobacillus horneckiae]MED2937217.1 PH domain-containing protein [Cytobacillus horneckiae]